MMRGDLVLIDTNVLLSATVASRADHTTSKTLLDRAPATGIHPVSTGQIFREYLAVATRDPTRNGLGIESSEALHNIRQFRTRLHLLPENREVTATLLGLVEQYHLSGTRIHDANLVAIMRVHDVRTLVTANTGDFEAFDDIRIITPDDALHELFA